MHFDSRMPTRPGTAYVQHDQSSREPQFSEHGTNGSLSSDCGIQAKQQGLSED